MEVLTEEVAVGLGVELRRSQSRYREGTFDQSGLVVFLFGDGGDVALDLLWLFGRRLGELGDVAHQLALEQHRLELVPEHQQHDGFVPNGSSFQCKGALAAAGLFYLELPQLNLHSFYASTTDSSFV